MKISHFRQLDVYKLAMEKGIQIFEISKSFPAVAKYSLTDQIRRSSRSVCANLAEAWRKRRYKAAFVAKLSDSESEAAETQVWLEFALAHKYIDKEKFDQLDDSYDRICGMIVRMLEMPEKWCPKK